jgi:exopolysaccharide biosynthesis polyprenyl glycosylphosphotransferase
MIGNKLTMSSAVKISNSRTVSTSQNFRNIRLSVRGKLTAETYVIFALLAGAYFLASASYQGLVMPYRDLWPTDFKLISAILTISPAFLLVTRGVLYDRSAQTPRTTALLILVLANVIFVSVMALDVYRDVHGLTENDLRPLLWAVFWLLVAPLTVELPRFYSQYLAEPTFDHPKVAVIATPGSIGHLKIDKVVDKQVYALSAAAVGEAVAVKGQLDDLIKMGQERGIRRIVLTLLPDELDIVDATVEKLIPLAADVYLHTIAQTDAPDFEGKTLSWQALKLISRRPLGPVPLALKTIEDFCLGAALTFLFAPLMSFIALAIMIDSPGPIFFKQKRHGYRNREIEVFKFRTMRQDKLDYGCNQQTRRGDARITRVGSFLRKSSLDELPQLLNVMRGEMSLVGPRPHAVNMRTERKLSHEIVPNYACRHQVKPGITGWAQVNGCRGAMEFEKNLVDRVQFDMEYIKKCSIVFDFYILVKTIFHLAGTKNAY